MEKRKWGSFMSKTIKLKSGVKISLTFAKY